MARSFHKITMNRKLSYWLLSLWLGWGIPLSAQEVPQQITYCGIELNLTEAARQQLQALVDQQTNSPRYFNQMVQKARKYMPFIEEAFKAVGVPQDLKYLAIQESGLRPSVVSSSEAVGFWQLKEPTGKELGLHIDRDVDERRHIFRASLAAARYLSRANYYFDNWVYAVIAYYEGQSGSIGYTDASYYSQRRMTVDSDLHWYAMKAIAHKLAYAPALRTPGEPEVYLLPYSTEGETDLRALMQRHAMSEEAFGAYNPWILNRRRLPRHGRNFSYYVPVSPGAYTGHVPDPTFEASPAATPAGPVPAPPLEATTPEPRPKPSLPSSVAPAAQATGDQARDPYRQLSPSAYAAFPFLADPHYGEVFLRYDGNTSLRTLARRHGVKYDKFLEWNQLMPNDIPQAGTILYLKKLSRADFHIVMPGEDLTGIAAMHRTRERRIQRKNRMDRDQTTIYVGQKLYLRPKKRKGEKLIVLVDDEQWLERRELALSPGPLTQSPAVTPERPREPEREDSRPADEPDSSPPSSAEPKTSLPPVKAYEPEPRVWVTHQVNPGETLWQISKRYDTRVEIIRRSNNLRQYPLSWPRATHTGTRIAMERTQQPK